jgi:formylglycine-generating enzyme required for sulfatase activity
MASPIKSEQLDLRPPKKWRRFVPSWLRSLIWVDSAGRYDAFMSYSWKSDSELAPVIQSVLQRFLCPWYKLRAKTIFRDLSCLPAGSSLESELFDRLDRSTHLIVLASPEAALSHGMEMEARHWFSQTRDGQVLIVVTSGEHNNWDSMRKDLLPPAVRDSLTSEPLWIPLQHRRSQILADAKSHEVRSQLIEDLKQVLLCLYPERDWGQLRGEERKQRRRALGLMSGLALLLLSLAIAATGFALYAQTQRRTALTAQGRALEALNEVIRRLELQVASNDPTQVSLAIEQLISVHQRAPSEVLALIPDDRFASNAFFLALLTRLESAAHDVKTGSWARQLRVALGKQMSVARKIAPPPTESVDESLNKRILLKGSRFRMGSRNGSGCEACADETPIHWVQLRSFSMQQHLVTNREYARFDPKHRSRDPSTPAVNVTWYDALMYAVWLGGDLPTEAQWEFAARGIDGRKYPWGNDEPRMTSDPLVETEHPARPSAAGIWDLSGRAWQWCRDVYGPYPASEQQDPTGPNKGYVRVLRGGSYHDRAEFLRAAYRYNYHPAVSTSNAGFRVVWATTDEER